MLLYFFFNDTATTEVFTLSLHDALPISRHSRRRGVGRHRVVGISRRRRRRCAQKPTRRCRHRSLRSAARCRLSRRSEEHTSELQSRQYLVCRLLLEKKKKVTISCIMPVI